MARIRAAAFPCARPPTQPPGGAPTTAVAWCLTGLLCAAGYGSSDDETTDTDPGDPGDPGGPGSGEDIDPEWGKDVPYFCQYDNATDPGSTCMQDAYEPIHRSRVSDLRQSRFRCATDTRRTPPCADVPECVPKP